MTADLDYVLGGWVADVTAFGAFCTRLISRVSLVRHLGQLRLAGNSGPYRPAVVIG